MYVPGELDYISLMRLGAVAPSANGGARVAVVGFATTQYYAGVLRGLGTAAGFPLATYEPEYDTVHQTLLDEDSELYSYRPDFIVFLTAVQRLRHRLLTADPAERPGVGLREADELVSLVRIASQIPGVTVVVNEFVVPYERPWGNFSLRVDASPARIVRAVNDRLREAAAAADNVYTVDCDHIAAWAGKKAWFDERLWFHSKSFCHPEVLPQVAGQALDVFRAVKGNSLKCIALDLDNVLWGGTIGDDGMEGIRLGELGDGEAYVHFQLWLKQLRDRGLVLAVCSKNDEEKALAPFRGHPGMALREADVSCFVANWVDKAQNLREIARRLNIGLDSIVFLDDSPFERNLVRELAPEVCVPELPADPADFVPYLESLNLFEAGQFSEEDRKRAGFYTANALRESELQKYASVDEYLAGLGSTAVFERFDDYHLPRIAQLVQKTNQFNLTTVRHTAEELRRFADDPSYFPFYVTLADRFGDNGLISVVIGRREGSCLDIVSWLMSCRVMSRRLEEFALDRLVEVAHDAGFTRLRGRYVPTAKNGLVSKHYERLGFRLVDELPDGSTTWELDVCDYLPSEPPIERAVAQLGA
jgi:FkbH-like protein